LVDKLGKDAYPISGVIYAVCFQDQPTATRQRAVDFLRWSTHKASADGQDDLLADTAGVSEAGRSEAGDDQGGPETTGLILERRVRCVG
jgi:hypothetical protein